MPDWIWIQNVVFPILGMGLGAFAMFAIYRTVNRHLDRRHERFMAERNGSPGSSQLEELRARVEELEEGSLRMQDLEERLDFAERLLAQQQRKELDSRGRGG